MAEEVKEIRQVPAGLLKRWKEFPEAVRSCWRRAKEKGLKGKEKVGEYLTCWEEMR